MSDHTLYNDIANIKYTHMNHVSRHMSLTSTIQKNSKKNEYEPAYLFLFNKNL